MTPKTTREEITVKDCNATQNANGSWTVAAIVDGFRKATQYYGYSRRESLGLFVDQVNVGAI